MSSFNQLNCFGCGEPIDDVRCRWCTCERCGYDLRDGFCLFCNSRDGNSFAYDPNPNSFNDSQNLSDYPPQPQYQTYSCELCGNDAHYGYDCPPQVPIVYNQEPCFNQNFDNNFPQTSSSFPQQYLCCENCGGPHESISDDTYDVPFCDNSPPLDVLNDHFEIFSDFNDDCTSSDDDSFENIDYVEASLPDSELVSLEELKDDILREKLLNINLLIAKIESLNDNPTPDCVFNSPFPFPIPVEDSDSFFEKSDTSLFYSDNSYPNSRLLAIIRKRRVVAGKLTSVVMEDIMGEPRVHVPTVLPIHSTLMLDSDFIPSDDSLESDLEVSFPSGTSNKIFDPRIFFEVQSKRFLSRDTFSISFICNLLCPVIDTLLPFSSDNEDKVFNLGIPISKDD
ncbi:hypothetical protein Tco_1352978 [Tanacetum coccineum]